MNKLKKQTLFFYTLSALAAMSLICSCNHSIPKIGFMLPHTTIRRYLVEKDVFTKKIEELGGKVIFASADNDEEKQIQQLKELLAQDIDVLVLDPVNRFRAPEMVRAAHDKGINVISYDRLAANCNVDALIMFDATAVGNQMTSYALNKRPSGNYIILGGDKSDNNAVMINTAIEKSLEPMVKSGKIKILYKAFIEKYSVDDTENILSTVINLSQENPDAVITPSDAMAHSVIKTLKKYDLDGQVIVTGQNGDLVACKNIVKRKQSMTIYKPVKKMASATAEIAFKLAKGENIKQFFTTSTFNGSKDIPTYLFQVISVDALNLKSTIIADGFYTENEVFK